MSKTIQKQAFFIIYWMIYNFTYKLTFTFFDSFPPPSPPPPPQKKNHKKNSCKQFNRLKKEKMFFTTLIIPHCFRVGNKQATFWVGVHKYFEQDQTTRGKEILLQANIEGDKM